MARKNVNSGHGVVESVYGEASGQQGKVLGSKIIRAENKKAPSATNKANLTGSGSGSAKAKKNNKKKGAKGGKGGKTGTKSGAQGGGGVPQVLDPAAIKKREKKAREAFRSGRVLLEKLVEGSDVVLVVLDVRDPQRCRSTFLEKLVQESGKKLVFVLNKIDMVPRHNVERWLEVLRQEHTTVPFNAVESSSNSADALAEFVKSQSISSGDKKASFTVGIVGFPSVGRASVLRSLRQSKELSSSSSIKFYVNLGALLNKGGHGPIDSMLRSKLLPNDDLVSAAASILMRCKQQFLMITYSVPRFDTGKEFLESLARQQGHLFKGAVPDTLTAARSILRELSSGKSPFYTNPPTSTTGAAKKIKGKGYGVDAKRDETVLRAMEFSDELGFSFALAAQNGLEEDPEDDGEEEEEKDEAPMLIPAVGTAKQVQSKKQVVQEQDMDEEEEEEEEEDLKEDEEEDEEENEEEDEDEIVPSTTTKRGAKSAPVQKRPVKKAKKTNAVDEDGNAPYTFGEFA